MSDGFRLWTVIFKSNHRFSIGLKSGLWLSHSNIYHSSVALAVCFGSLFCWKVNLCSCLKSQADWQRFCSRISLLLAPSFFPWTWTSFLFPATEKHPHSMMLPTNQHVGMVFLGWWKVLGLHQTWRFPWWPKISILVSSDQSSLLANSKRAFLFLTLSNGFFFFGYCFVKPSSMEHTAYCGPMDRYSSHCCGTL